MNNVPHTNDASVLIGQLSQFIALSEPQGHPVEGVKGGCTRVRQYNIKAMASQEPFALESPAKDGIRRSPMGEDQHLILSTEASSGLADRLLGAVHELHEGQIGSNPGWNGGRVEQYGTVAHSL